MGENKLLLRGDDGLLLVRRWFQRLHWPGVPWLVLPPDASPPPDLADWRVAHDAVGGEGPLRGVAAALAVEAPTPWRLVVPVDMPGLCRTQIDWLADRRHAGAGPRLWMARRGGVIEPFPMLIHVDQAPAVARRLAEGRRSLHGLAGEPLATVVDAPADWPADAWMNLNRPADLAAYRARYSG